MWKVFIWPVISICLILLYRIYELFFPCDSGLFIAGCGMGQLFLYVLTVETWAVYLVIALILLYIEKRTGKSIHFILYGFLGIMITVILIVNALQMGINGFILLYMFGISEHVLEVLREAGLGTINDFIYK